LAADELVFAEAAAADDCKLTTHSMYNFENNAS